MYNKLKVLELTRFAHNQFLGDDITPTHARKRKKKVCKQVCCVYCKNIDSNGHNNYVLLHTNNFFW